MNQRVHCGGSWIKEEFHKGFPCGSARKESTCNAGDLGSIPRLGRSPGEGKDYPLQYSGLENSMECIVHGVVKSWTQLSDLHSLTHFTRASIVAQLVKNPPAMRETWVWSLGLEDPWRRERLATPVFWPGEFHGLQSMGLQRVRHDWATFTFTSQCHPHVKEDENSR